MRVVWSSNVVFVFNPVTNGRTSVSIRDNKVDCCPHCMRCRYAMGSTCFLPELHKICQILDMVGLVSAASTERSYMKEGKEGKG
ncbi:uncharacterized protein LOC130711924 isoform X3 [Lotus japonicus]|uniref:uncharacterized protein LOC130711924 isoform X3 n=1 Tax=Lotus japonicus TaxID=34305 RepID=UPI0025891C46|nr:uncharacterized protein LOC130711924 isoform X3 [Lotus japonicus]